MGRGSTRGLGVEMRLTNLEEIVEEFADAAIKADEATFTNGRMARKYSNKEIKCWKKILQFGDQGKEELSRLLNHPDPSARVAAAGYLLKFKTEEALAVLHEAAQHEGLVPFVAQECLKRWEEGTWALDP